MFLLQDDDHSPEEQLARDEGLLDAMETLHSSEIPDDGSEWREEKVGSEVLRLWTFSRPVVVMGRSSRISDEVNVDACNMDGVPVLRRSSGGATIVAGPGCLMYSVLIDYRSRPAWRMLDVAHQAVMDKLAAATQSTLDDFRLPKRIEWKGTCDLTIDGRKFSGNALRCRRNFMIYHGTILIQMPLSLIARYLLQPPRQPEYRKDRDHLSFVCNLLEEDFSDADQFKLQLIENLAAEWNATEAWDHYPHKDLWIQQSEELLHRKYLSPNWHRERL